MLLPNPRRISDTAAITNMGMSTRLTPQASASLPRISVPTLVLGCDGSHVSPASQAYIAQRIPDAELHVFPTSVASSHFVFLENPGAFNDVVTGFLS